MKARILVPFDFSEAAACALNWAVDLVRSLGGGAIKLVHVVNIMPTAADLGASMTMPTEAEIGKLKTALEETAAEHAPGALTELVMATDVAAAIVDAAQAFSAELIVMGSHGRGAVGRLVFGSVASHVSRHASCPVVTMRARS